MSTQTPIKPAITLTHTLGLTFSWRMNTESAATRTGATHTMAEKSTKGMILSANMPNKVPPRRKLDRSICSMGRREIMRHGSRQAMKTLTKTM